MLRLKRFLSELVRISILLLIGIFHAKIIENIFVGNVLINLTSIFLSSLLFPVFFVLAEKRKEIEKYLEVESYDRTEIESILNKILKFWPSFSLILLISWITTLLEIDKFLISQKLSSGLISLNYGLILVIVVYYFRRDIFQEKLQKILNSAERIELI